MYEWLRLPFGLRTATASFHRMFTRIMGPTACICGAGDAAPWDKHSKVCQEETAALINKVYRIFVDDGLVYSADEEDHVEPSKCTWGTHPVPILGHVVTAGEGIKPDPSKVEAITKLGTPRTVAMLKNWLGMTGYLENIVPHYATLVAPLRKISALFPKKSEKDITDLWSPEAEAAFRATKIAVAESTALAFPDFSQPFITLVDSSHNGMGATLAQLDEEGRECPIAYASTSLTKCQKNYGISDLEGCGVVWAVRKCAPYLHSGAGVNIVVTDHACLSSLMVPNKEFNSTRLARYALELS